MTGAAAKSDAPPSSAIDWRVRMLVPVAMVLVSLLTRTWRIRTRNAEGWQRLRAEKKPWIFALWHSSLLPASFQHRKQNIAVLVSQHRDGEIIARVLAAWGNSTVRGSTTRGGARALLAMIGELERGIVVAVTPDGPRGPATKFQSGALVAAQRANVPVVPLLIHADRAWRLKSWDRFMIPKFFARVTIAYGDPAFVGGSSPRDAAAEAERFEALMNETQRAADA